MARKNQNTANTPPLTNGGVLPKKSTAQMLLDKYGVDTLFENSKGEFFTNYNLALISEGNKKDNVKTHNKE